jgi:monoamine oxidase
MFEWLVINMDSKLPSTTEQTTVVIVGGGVSGLAAAKTLQLNNISYILLEAQDYLGGRVHTIKACRINLFIITSLESFSHRRGWHYDRFGNFILHSYS